MADLREALNLPIIGGEIIAVHYQHELRWHTNWRLKFIINGPDARYNRGEASLDINDVKKLISALEEAYDKMASLQQQSFSGTFSKQIGELYNPRVELKAENGNVYINFWVSSGNWQFSRILNSGQLKIIIEKLKTVEEQGERMVKTLNTLDVPDKVPDKDSDKVPDGYWIQEAAHFSEFDLKLGSNFYLCS